MAHCLYGTRSLEGASCNPTRSARKSPILTYNKLLSESYHSPQVAKYKKILLLLMTLVNSFINFGSLITNLISIFSRLNFPDGFDPTTNAMW